jgi:hypothetical protein
MVKKKMQELENYFQGPFSPLYIGLASENLAGKATGGDCTINGAYLLSFANKRCFCCGLLVTCLMPNPALNVAFSTTLLYSNWFAARTLRTLN